MDEIGFRNYLKQKKSPQTGKAFDSKMISDALSRIRKTEAILLFPIESWGVAENFNKDDLKNIRIKVKSIIENQMSCTKSRNWFAMYFRAIKLYNEFHFGCRNEL